MHCQPRPTGPTYGCVNSAVAILKFLILFEQGAPRFYFALTCINYIAGLAFYLGTRNLYQLPPIEFFLVFSPYALHHSRGFLQYAVPSPHPPATHTHKTGKKFTGRKYDFIIGIQTAIIYLCFVFMYSLFLYVVFTLSITATKT